MSKTKVVLNDMFLCTSCSINKELVIIFQSIIIYMRIEYLDVLNTND